MPAPQRTAKPTKTKQADNIMDLPGSNGDVRMSGGGREDGEDVAKSAPLDALSRADRRRHLTAILDRSGGDRSSDDDDDDRSEDDDHDDVAAQTLALLAARNAEGAAANQQRMRTASMGDRAFMCVECQAHAAELFCEQCHDYFCELCFGGQHRKGNRRLHTSQPVVVAEKEGAVVKEQGAVDGVEKMDVDDSGANTGHSASASDSETSDSDDEEEDDTSEHTALARAGGFWGAGAYTSTSAARKLLTNGLLPGSSTTGDDEEVPVASGSVSVAAAQSTVRERAKYIPVRLTYEERKLLRTLEAALRVSSYTDKLDAPACVAPAKRLRMQLQEICGFLSGLVVAFKYKTGQAVLQDKEFATHAEFFQELFELGRRYKIMNPEKMRGEYGKLMYLLQDALRPEIQELLGFSCHKPIRTVYAVLAEANALGVLSDARIETATMVVAPEGKTRPQIQRLIKRKEQAIREISARYASSSVSPDTIHQCLYSIADNNYHLYFERDPIDRMIQLLTVQFHPETTKEGHSLAISSGQEGARLSHSHARQFHYVLQSLTLWREIAHDMFRLWCLTDDDLLDGSVSTTETKANEYTLADTGQGWHRVQTAPRVSRAMHVILHMTQRSLDAWVGSSVIHLGDKNVPNALMFIDKYTQVGHILRPIVKTVDAVDRLVASSNKLQRYVDSTFGGAAQLKCDILADFFREAFDGSGADNFFEAGSCIDGRLTSAWNWCSRLHSKRFYPIFKLAGFVGFDGKFG